MRFARSDYADEVVALRLERRAERRALGDNFAFEENLGSDRGADFERFVALDPGLLAAVSDYFFTSVQGSRREHTPSTFTPINAPALMSSAIEPNQKIVRIEQIDDVVSRYGLDFDAIRDACKASSPDASVVALLLRGLNAYPGARPAFACFRAEVAADLAEADWLPRLRERLGLGHFSPAAGETWHFVRMEYTAADVFSQAAMAQPFAVPTVLETRNSEFFFPAPAGVGFGHTVDLNPAALRSTVREFLHVRLTYDIRHVKQVAALTGPLAAIPLAAARDSHLGRLRAASGRSEYGAMMAGDVDA